jgi:uncharacterized protein involved in copper resistance
VVSTAKDAESFTWQLPDGTIEHRKGEAFMPSCASQVVSQRNLERQYMDTSAILFMRCGARQCEAGQSGKRERKPISHASYTKTNRRVAKTEHKRGKIRELLEQQMKTKNQTTVS